MGTLDELLPHLSDDQNVKGRQFEDLCVWYLTHDPKYVAVLKRLWRWEKWPGRWGVDAGIDLVAESHEGKLWAIQCKAYSQHKQVTKHDVNTFLSESNRLGFSYRLLIATTDRISPTAYKTLREQEKPAYVLRLSELRRSPVKWPSSFKKLEASQPKPRSALPHQKDAVRATLLGFRTANRGRLIMACGTGKTLIGVRVAEALNSKRTLILLPSLSLLAQTLRDWTRDSTRRVRILPVCSDETVRGDSDHLVNHIAELGFPATTDPTEIATFLRGRGPSIVLSTYQSSPRIAEAFARHKAPSFDLAIADEAHRCAGSAIGNFATILKPEAIHARKRLFMTATPRYFTDRVRKLASQEEFEVASMDDETLFGPEFHRLDFSDAIARGLLSDYQVAIVGVDNPTYRKYAEHGRLVIRDRGKHTDARALASSIALADAMRKYDLRRTISFHGRVERAKRFAAEFRDTADWMPAEKRPRGTIVTGHVSGSMPSGQRDVQLQQLSDLANEQYGLLTNARCLSEGVDLPALDGVAFIDPKGSQIDIIQAVGRAIRKAENKRHGTIVLPVFIENEDDPDLALENSNFQAVWAVIKALRAHDPLLGEQLDAIRRWDGRRSGRKPTLPPKLKLDLPVTVTKEFATAFSAQLVERTTANWEFWFGLLERYQEREGRASPPVDYVQDGHRLGKWADHQRRFRRTGDLPTERERSLEHLGFVWDPDAAAWEAGFEALRRFAAEHGEATPSAKHCNTDGYKLGAWVRAQRRGHMLNTLRPERRTALEGLPGWSWQPLRDRFETGYRHLVEFVLENGHASIPQDVISADGFLLGQWVSVQRTSYAQGKLSAGRIERLEALDGWVWNVREVAWEEGFSCLQAFAKREGHASPSHRSVENSYQLGTWVIRQRRRYRNGNLSVERIRRLEALPSWDWNPSRTLRGSSLKA